MKISPLAITKVHWPTFIKFAQDNLGYSPTRGLDDAGISPNEPASYLACLGLDNKPLEQLRSCSQAWKHFHASFICVAPLPLLNKLYTRTDLKVTNKIIEDTSDYLTIVTGNMLQWRQAILNCCSSGLNKDKDIREFGNYCLIYFQEAGFREVFHDCDKIGLEDQTFTVRIRP